MSDDNAGSRSGNTPPALAPGGVVAGGRYRLVAPHGGGAGLRYWQARDLRLGREVALVFVDPTPNNPVGARSAGNPVDAGAPRGAESPAAGHPDDAAAPRAASSAPSADSAPGIAPAATGPTSADSAASVLDATLSLTRMWAPGLAGVLDVVRGKVGGIIVAEWTPGRPLAEAASGQAMARDAATALKPLAEATKRVHENGATLGLFSPDQVRVTPDGSAVLAFPGVVAAADRQRDVKCLGAVLYALQTGSWPQPLPVGAADVPVTADRLPDASRDPDGTPVDPQRRGASPAMAALAMRSLDGSSVSSAATILSLLDDDPARGRRAATHSGASGTAAARGTAGGDHHDGASYLDDSSSFDDSYSEDHHDRSTESRAESTADDRRRKQKQWIIMAATGAVALVVIVVLLIQMMGGFGGKKDDVPLSAQLDAIERQAQASREAAAGKNETRAEDPKPTGQKLTVSDATTWQPPTSNGTAENPGTAKNAVDGSTSTTWQTDTYNAQFGNGGSAYKPGLGLMLTVEQAAKLTEVTVTAKESGVRFEVRAATSESPADLASTTLLGNGTTTAGSPATATLDTSAADQSTKYVLIWITKLAGSTSQGFSATIQEVGLQGTK